MFFTNLLRFLSLLSNNRYLLTIVNIKFFAKNWGEEKIWNKMGDCKLATFHYFVEKKKLNFLYFILILYLHIFNLKIKLKKIHRLQTFFEDVCSLQLGLQRVFNFSKNVSPFEKFVKVWCYFKIIMRNNFVI